MLRGTRIFAISLLLSLCIHLSVCAAPLTKGAQILIVGDSNTERGKITGALKDILEQKYGDFGSGYVPFAKNFSAMPSGMSMSYGDGSWETFDMVQQSNRTTPPNLGPAGFWTTSTAQNATADVGFEGTAVDLYWLKQPSGGEFSVSVDGGAGQNVGTQGEIATGRTSITGLGAQTHSMHIAVSSGAVTLLGVDAKRDVAGQDFRAAVHNWGNGFATTRDFMAIDSVVFTTSLELLAPDVVVILLGTNDHNFLSVTPAEFEANLLGIIGRIQVALPSVDILLVSTFETNSPSATTLLHQYRATSYPQAASETGIVWFGPYESGRMDDNFHCNTSGGAAIGEELWSQIDSRFGYTQSSIRHPNANRRIQDARVGPQRALLVHSVPAAMRGAQARHAYFTPSGARITTAACPGAYLVSPQSNETPLCVWTISR